MKKDIILYDLSHQEIEYGKTSDTRLIRHILNHVKYMSEFDALVSCSWVKSGENNSRRFYSVKEYLKPLLNIGE